MAYLNHIEQVRAIEWGAKYLWDVKFVKTPDTQGAPPPFDKWFPAVDVEEELAHLESYQFDSAQDSFKVPSHSTALSFRVTFHDDVTHSLLNWFKDWINSIVVRGQNGGYVSTLDQSVRLISLLKLDHSRQEVPNGTSSYWVYPEGTIVYSGDSSSDSTTYQVSFVIVGQG